MRFHERLDAEANAAGWWTMDPRPIETIIAHYSEWAKSMASRRHAENDRVDIDSYEQNALIGLWEAAESFVPGQSAFTTWAHWRIRGQLTEAERSNDWVGAKTRAAYNAGQIHLPAMVPLSPLDDAPESEYTDPSDRLREVLDAAPPLVRGIGKLSVETAHDVDAVAARLGVSDSLAGHLIHRWLPGALQAVPVLN